MFDGEKPRFARSLDEDERGAVDGLSRAKVGKAKDQRLGRELAFAVIRGWDERGRYLGDVCARTGDARHLDNGKRASPLSALKDFDSVYIAIGGAGVQSG